jgi:hypothetical protein
MSTQMPIARFTARVLTGSMLVAGLAACNQDTLLKAPTPDVVRPQDISGASALPTAYASAIGDFQLGYAGGYGNGLDNNEGIVQISGLLSDELINTETFNTRIEVDRRATNAINATTLQTFQDLQRSRASADLIASRFHQFLPADARGAEVQALAAYAYVLLAENYCNGVPISRLNEDGTFTYGAPLTGATLLATAIAKFDSSITVATAAGATGETALNLARIGRGRALLDLNRVTEAAVAVAEVPSSFNYSFAHSANTGRENNATYAFNYLEQRFGVGNREGTNGVPFVELADPRVAPFDFGTGFDNATEEYLSGKYYARNAPTQLTIGSEARLIEAEAAFRAGNIATMLTKLNDARANASTYSDQFTGPIPNTLAPLTLADLGTTTGSQRQVLFQERALTLYLTSHRVGDLRRLISQYKLNAESVFPTGIYVKSGGVYGTAVNLPIPNEEGNNPSFLPAACINRSADFQ